MSLRVQYKDTKTTLENFKQKGFNKGNQIIKIIRKLEQ